MKAADGELVSATALLKGIEKMSPELKAFAISEQSLSRVGMIKELLEAVPTKMNTSGTGKTLDALWKHVPGTALGMATMITGHNPATALIVGGLTELISRDAPDAIRLAVLKFLGSNQKIDAEGFKALHATASAALLPTP
jgi:hypothetical protein